MKNLSQNGDKWLALTYPADRRPRADLEVARKLQSNTLDWCRQFFLKHIPQLEKALARLDTGLFSVLVYPGAKKEAAQFLSDFMAWWFLLDDRLESRHDRLLSAEKRHTLFKSYMAALRNDDGAGEKEDSFIASARDLGSRLPKFARPGLCRRFCDSMEDWLFKGVEKEMAICGDPSKKDVASYFQIRPFSSGVLPTLYLGEAASAEIPRQEAQNPMIAEFLKKAGEIIYLGNDIFSYHKEVKRPCNFNLAIILKRQQSLSEQSALNDCARYHNEAVSEYIALKNRLRETGADLWLQGMDNVLAGLIAWQRSALRYEAGNCFWYWE